MKPHRDSLFLHLWLFAAAVYVAAHDPASIYAVTVDTSWGGGWLWPGLIWGNALLWFGYTQRRIPLPPEGGSLLRSLPLYLWLPALAFAALSTVYAVGAGRLTARWGAEAVAYPLTVLMMADIFRRTQWMPSAEGEPAQPSNRHPSRPLLLGLAVAGAAVCVEGMVALFTREGNDLGLLVIFPRFLRSTSRPYAEYRLGGDGLPYPTLLASLLLVFAAVSLGLVAGAKTKGERTAWWGLWALLALCMGLTASRAGVIFLLLMTLAHAARRRGVWRSAALGSMARLGTGVALALIEAPGRFLRGDGSLRSRFHMWRVCLRIARNHLLVGGGPDAFSIAWPDYARRFGYPHYVVPHSLYFGLLAEGGLLLLTAAGLLIAGVAREVGFVLRSAAPSAAREGLLALALGLTAALAHDLIENACRTAPLYLLGCALAGMAVGMRRGERRLVSV